MPAYGHPLLLRRGSDRRSQDDRAVRFGVGAGGRDSAQYSLLRKIERAGAVSLTELGRMADLDRSTVGRNVKVLERLRLVRLAPAKDQREAAVKLTPAGAEALWRAAPLWEDAQRRVETALGAGSAEQLRTLALSL